MRRNVYQAARGLEPDDAAVRIEAGEQNATELATAALEQVIRDAEDEGAAVRLCAVVVGAFGGAPLASILASHALAHAAEGRLYQQALLRGAESVGLDSVAVPKKSIWEAGASILGVPENALQDGIVSLRREIGPPWAEDQKLAAVAAWIALAAR